nr:MAG TPA: hypothetical protein [Caudoviricetes sp.]
MGTHTRVRSLNPFGNPYRKPWEEKKCENEKLKKN